ncbi:AraC family transcriptional regulator with amidase-like domain [Haloactinopolyspora alba]|uniref:AraC family transcriptional regulator with amidase-like domain n=1 Tax=Haloactinopolyspora alba TaxID=648780 RepID=A0A2P8EBM8_9ACTN|nr:helix-turn-helix domain-containing protein [Haloactinopolyspora alba]PSL06875.1 AraC family transcriptional regulator with amidase-like domain [Haloactinopolyspora alba]
MTAPARPHHVAVLAYEGMSAFELGIVTEVFGVTWPDTPSYRLTVCAEGDGTVDVVGGASLRTPHTLDTLAAADTVIVPSVSDVHAEATAELAGALRQAHARSARIVSICTGAFALASSGLLDGRPATTHWLYTDLLARRFPHVEVDPTPLYVDDGDILTSAGSAAGLDLCLHLVRQDFGATAANAMARRLVAAPHREGGQAQYIESPVRPDPEDDRITASMSWAVDHLPEPITVDTLARHARMSTRTYLRHFTRATGTSPIKWLIGRRIQASLPLLERTDTPVERVAETVGFDTAVTFRHHFTRAMRTSPSSYRRAFRTGRT